MHFLSNSVTTEFPIHSETMTLCIFFDHISNIWKFCSRFDNLNSFKHCFSSDFTQSFDFWVDITEKDHRAVVSMVTTMWPVTIFETSLKHIFEANNINIKVINIKVITIFQLIWIWYSMRNNGETTSKQCH